PIWGSTRPSAWFRREACRAARARASAFWTSAYDKETKGGVFVYVQQISVFIENQPGKLAEFAELLGREGIDLVALSIADTTNFGILRCIVCDYERAAKIIGEAGYTARVTDVLAVSVPDKPGGMAQAVRA